MNTTSLVQTDQDKRHGGYKIKSTVDEKEKIILQVASGEIGLDQFTNWLGAHIAKIKPDLNFSK